VVCISSIVIRNIVCDLVWISLQHGLCHLPLSLLGTLPLIVTSEPALARRLPVRSAVSHVGFMMVCRMVIAYMNTGVSPA